jgi:hypothetical protein
MPNVVCRRPRRNKIPLLPPVSTPPITMPDAPIGDRAAVVIARLVSRVPTTPAIARAHAEAAGLLREAR